MSPAAYVRLGLLAFTSTAAQGAVTQLGAFSTATFSDTLSSFTAPAGADRLLVVIASHAATSVNSGFNVEYDSTPLTLAASGFDGFFANDQVWYLPLGTSALSTTANITVTRPALGTTGPETFIHAVVFQGVYQVNPISASNSAQVPSGVGLDSTLAILGGTGDIGLDIFDAYTSGASTGQTPGSSQTQLGDLSFALPSGFANYNVSTKPGPFSTMSWTTADAEAFIHVAVTIHVPEAGTVVAGAMTVLMVGLCAFRSITDRKSVSRRSAGR